MPIIYFNVLHGKSGLNYSSYLLFPDIFSWHCVMTASKENFISSLHSTIIKPIFTSKIFPTFQINSIHQFSAVNSVDRTMANGSWGTACYQDSQMHVRTMHLIQPEHACLVIPSQSPEMMDELHITFIQQNQHVLILSRNW